MEIGEAIRHIREMKNLTQEHMARELDMTQQGYGRIEKGVTDVSFSRLHRIAQIFRMSLSDVINFQEGNAEALSGQENIALAIIKERLEKAEKNLAQFQDQLHRVIRLMEVELGLAKTKHEGHESAIRELTQKIEYVAASAGKR